MFSWTALALADSTSSILSSLPCPSISVKYRMGWARCSDVEARKGRAQCQAVMVIWLQNWHFIGGDEKDAPRV